MVDQEITQKAKAQLEAYLDAHIHPTFTGPSGPPVIPASVFNAVPVTSFKSQWVKVRSNL